PQREGARFQPGREPCAPTWLASVDPLPSGLMTASIDRRAFLKRAGAATVALSTAPLAARRAAAASDRLAVAVDQWGTETTFAWRPGQAAKPLWDCVH